MKILAKMNSFKQIDDDNLNETHMKIEHLSDDSSTFNVVGFYLLFSFQVQLL